MYYWILKTSNKIKGEFMVCTFVNVKDSTEASIMYLKKFFVNEESGKLQQGIW